MKIQSNPELENSVGMTPFFFQQIYGIKKEGEKSFKKRRENGYRPTEMCHTYQFSAKCRLLLDFDSNQTTIKRYF